MVRPCSEAYNLDIGLAFREGGGVGGGTWGDWARKSTTEDAEDVDDQPPGTASAAGGRKKRADPKGYKALMKRTDASGQGRTLVPFGSAT